MVYWYRPKLGLGDERRFRAFRERLFFMLAYMEGGEAFDEETSAEGPHGHGLLVGDFHAFGGLITMQPVMADSIFDRIRSIVTDIYGQIVAISTIVAVTVASIALIVRMISRNQRPWMKRRAGSSA